MTKPLDHLEARAAEARFGSCPDVWLAGIGFLGPAARCHFSRFFFGWEGSPTKIDVKKQVGTLILRSGERGWYRKKWCKGPGPRLLENTNGFHYRIFGVGAGW